MPVENADLAWAIADLKGRLPSLRLFKRYDEGDHRLNFATEKFRNTFGDLFSEFADNLCDDVLNGITDRLQISSWGSTANTDKALAEAVEAVWTRNRGDSRLGAVHRNAFRDGDGFALVETGKDQKSRIWKQDARQIAVRYSDDDPDEMEVAARVWKVGTRYRINLMYPDRIERYASKGSTNDGGLPSAGAFGLLAEGDVLLKGDTQPTEVRSSIPLFHFPNGDVSCYGRSLLLPVIPLQDALNKSIADMLVAMEFQAFPQRWATGVQVDPTPDPLTGRERQPFKGGPGETWWTAKEGGQFGQFSAAEMGGFLEVQKGFRAEIFRKGSQPAYDLGSDGNLPSGVALLVAEGRTVKMGKDRIRDWTPEHKRMMAAAATIDLGTDVLPDDLDPEWAPVETRDIKALLEELAMKKDLGVPTEQILKEMGYAPDEVQEFLDDADAQQEAEQVALQVLQGGRQSVTVGAAQTQADALGLPAAPAPPAGGATPLAGS